jgi:hypothetical protein
MNYFIKNHLSRTSDVSEYITGIAQSDDNIYIYDSNVVITTLDKPTFVINHPRDLNITISLSTAPTVKKWVYGVMWVEQLRPLIIELLHSVMLKLQEIKDIIFSRYGIETELVILTNFEENTHILEDKNKFVTDIQFKTFYINYIITDNERDKINRFLNLHITKKYDVGFVGTLSERRNKSIRLCEKEGLTVNSIIGTVGDKRDLELAKCKIIMCSHYYDNSSMYPNIRLDRFLFQDVPILCENCSDTELLDIKDYVTFTKLNDTGIIAKKILDNLPLIIPEEEKQKIKQQRLNHLNHVKSILNDMMR